MRSEKNSRAPNSWAGWLVIGLLCLAFFLVGRACGHPYAEKTHKTEAAIPDDRFAVPVQGGEGEETEPAMVLKLACLTFDDGPSPHTAKILEILGDTETPATFFVTAQDANRDYLPMVREIAARGHQVALHSATHDYKKIYASPAAFWLDIKALRQELSPYLDVDAIRWLRFPGGSTNTVSHRYGGRGIMQTLIREAGEKGYEWIDWNVCAQDAAGGHPDAARILANIKKDAAGRDICVVLMHDTKATGQTVKALPDVIGWFREEGYHFCTVEQMYEMRDGCG